MRLALQFEMPGLLENIRRIAPELEVVVLPPDQPVTLEKPVDALLASPLGGSQVEELLRQSPALDWVHVFGTGVDDYPLKQLSAQRVSCSKGATAVPIAEWVMAVILAQSKRLPGSWIDQPPEQWYMAELDSLAGKTLGLVGFGSIGQAVARRALAFDMEVLATVRRFRPSPVEGVTLLEHVDEVIERADHLVLALPATAASEGLMDAERLRRMKPGSHLVNISRAGLVDQEALRAQLDNGPLARASLDVVAPEPLPAGHWLYTHPKVRLSPHISWSSPQSYQRVFEVFYANLRRWLDGEPLEGLIDTDAGY
ncbi:hypothetical protein CWI75_04635 [Kineobactrum sediminis]|uniref:Dihydrofolate reductase n=1 Tax=Kineobactrum sediminis TaxID=1905677 RepID=A0A2N5Y5J9_9GAMM|nr:NAD(P)-dependent oxidoreductase [Kineobactrum sediminis]PLW83641.1 hypothetical protein CWI75_04635 [Kineobactrum sediminis]